MVRKVKSPGYNNETHVYYNLSNFWNHVNVYKYVICLQTIAFVRICPSRMCEISLFVFSRLQIRYLSVLLGSEIHCQVHY